MRLGPAHDDALVVAVHDAEVHVRVVLLGRAQAAVALHIRDRGGGHQLLALEAPHVVEDAPVVIGAPGPVEILCRAHQGVQLVASDARIAGERRALGQQLGGFEVLQQILGASRHVPEDVAVLAVEVGARDHCLRRLRVERGLVEPPSPTTAAWA